MRLTFRIAAFMLTLAGVYLAAALNTGPDQTDANLCALLRRTPWLGSGACVPMLGRYALIAAYAVAAICIVALVIDGIVWIRRRQRRKPQPPPPLPASISPSVPAAKP